MFLFEINAGIENLFDYSQNLPYGSNLGTLSPGSPLTGTSDRRKYGLDTEQVHSGCNEDRS